MPYFTAVVVINYSQPLRDNFTNIHMSTKTLSPEHNAGIKAAGLILDTLGFAQYDVHRFTEPIAMSDANSFTMRIFQSSHNFIVKCLFFSM